MSQRIVLIKSGSDYVISHIREELVQVRYDSEVDGELSNGDIKNLDHTKSIVIKKESEYGVKKAKVASMLTLLGKQSGARTMKMFLHKFLALCFSLWKKIIQERSEIFMLIFPRPKPSLNRCSSFLETSTKRGNHCKLKELRSRAKLSGAFKKSICLKPYHSNIVFEINK